MAAKFKLGQHLVTPAADDAMIGEDRLLYVARHAAGDWGVDEADKRANDAALIDGARVFSHTYSAMA